MTRIAILAEPGSVGLPAYEHDAPEEHVMETGAPAARYAVLEHTQRGWQVEQSALPYDHAAAAAKAQRNARPDWERALRVGFMHE